MPNLTLKHLQCKETEDNWGSDHAYIRVNGELVWGPTEIDDNDSMKVDITRNFVNQATIHLYDKDDMDPDDLLGTWVVNATESGERQAFFGDDDAVYVLYYVVS